jgi:hypothetical protein
MAEITNSGIDGHLSVVLQKEKSSVSLVFTQGSKYEDCTISRWMEVRLLPGQARELALAILDQLTDLE